jgi:hypothetical protein
MDLCKKEGKFEWRPIFMVPCGIMLACVLALVFIFKGQP